MGDGCLDLLGVHARALSDPVRSVHKVYALCKSADHSARVPAVPADRRTADRLGGELAA